MKKRLVSALLLLAAAVARADDDGYSRRGAAYLDLLPSARAAAMGYAHGAVIPREASDAANPATLSLMDAQYVSGTSGSLGLGRRLTNVGYVYPFHWNAKENMFRVEPYDMSTPRDTWRGLIEPAEAARYAVFVGGTTFGFDSIGGRSEFGAETGDFDASERNYGLGLSFRPYQNASFGLSGRYLQQKLYDANASGLAFSVGFWYGVPRFVFGNLDLALGYRDIGGKLNWEIDDPDLGISYTYKENIASKLYLAGAWSTPLRRLLVTLDVVQPSGTDTRVDAGVEVALAKIIRLRAGSHAYEPTFGWGMVLGRRALDIAVDYAFHPDSDSLSDAQWLTLTLRFLPVVAPPASAAGNGVNRLDRRAAEAERPAPPPAAAPAPTPSPVVSPPAEAPARQSIAPAKAAPKKPVRRPARPTLQGSTRKTKR